MKFILERRRRRSLLVESKQTIVNMGYPPVIASIFFEQFPQKYATLFAKWYKEYRTDRMIDVREWFITTFWSSRVGILDYIKVLEAAKKGESEYQRERERAGLGKDEQSFKKEEIIKLFYTEIKKIFLRDLFFDYSIVKDFIDGKIKDLTPYRKLKFDEAQMKYDEKNIFSDTTPLKKYKNGWRWVNTGLRCNLVGKKMKNCGRGSFSVLGSGDKEAYMAVLFDQNNNPHVVGTYSPKENLLKDVEGQAGTAPKEKYHKYILDLVKILDTRLQTYGQKSKLLSLKYLFRDIADEVVEVAKISGSVDKYFKISIDNQTYYGTRYKLIPQNKIEHVIDLFYKLKKEDYHDIPFAIRDDERQNLSFRDKLDSIFQYRYPAYSDSPMIKEIKKLLIPVRSMVSDVME